MPGTLTLQALVPEVQVVVLVVALALADHRSAPVSASSTKMPRPMVSLRREALALAEL